ncbi:MAG: DUF4188 domain-containing protein [Acidobacteria bacterium]|nr:DUF4188 domain-containing protein [Acidobacteriota bacterium]
MRVEAFRGLAAIFSIGPQIQKAVDAKPDGLLLHEFFLMGLFPLHVGMRQYWRDLESLERWTRESPHLEWWKAFHKDTKGTSFWHEAYLLRGGFDTVYVGLGKPAGLLKVAPRIPAHGSKSSARMRAEKQGTSTPDDLYPQR